MKIIGLDFGPPNSIISYYNSKIQMWILGKWEELMERDISLHFLQ